MTISESIIYNRLVSKMSDERAEALAEMLSFVGADALLEALVKTVGADSLFSTFELLLESEMPIFEKSKKGHEGVTTHGHGSLKLIVGKGENQDLTDADCQKIGRVIASMNGEAKKYYVGMINLLGASCRIHHNIKNSYIDAIRGGGKEAVPSSVEARFPGKLRTDAEEKEVQDKRKEKLKSLAKKTKDKEKKEFEAPQMQQEETYEPAKQPEVQAAQEPIVQEPAAHKPEPEKPEKQASPKQLATAYGLATGGMGKKKNTPFKQYVPQISAAKTRGNAGNRTTKK